MVEELVKQRIIEARSFKSKEYSLFPKRAKVLDFEPSFNIFDLKIGDEFILSGEGFLPDDFILGKRTVFLEQPLIIDGVVHYLEIKGYGNNGHELYPSRHEEGDLFYGTYLDSAKREFYLPNILRNYGILNIQKPSALLQYDEKDFVEYSAIGFAILVGARLQFGPHKQRMRKALHRICPEYKQLADDRYWEIKGELGKRMADEFLKHFRFGGVDEIKKWAKKYKLLDEVNGIVNGQEYGYSIRAVRSPLRVGDLNDRTIATEKNQQISREIGATVRKMLELGYWHITPNPGNWTTEGELVDFEDVAQYPKDILMIKQDMDFRNIATLEDYVGFTFGEGTVGYLAQEFQEGFMGSKTTEQEVINTTMCILDRLANM